MVIGMGTASGWVRGAAVGATTLLTVLGMAGCGDGEGEKRGAVTVDTLPGGTVRVHTAAEGLWDEGENWRLTEEARIGTATGGGPEAFADVRGLAADDLGRVWVLDTEVAEVRIFGRDGEFVRSVGGQGEGPGEFMGPNGLARGPDGNMYVFDPRTQRITVFDTAGRRLAEHRRPTGGRGFVWRGGFTRDGGLLDYRVQVGIVALGPDLTPRDTVQPAGASAEGTSPYFSGPNRMGGRTVMAVPYLGRPTWEAGPEGRIWHAPTRPYRFYVLSTEMDTVKIVERDYEPVPVSQAERDSAEARVRRRYAPSADLDLSRIPETKPAVEELFFDPEGNLWARPFLSGDSTGHAFDVFDEEGRYLGRVRSPVQLRRWPDPVVRDGRLYGVTVDELDVPYVVRLRIEMPNANDTRDTS